MTILDIITSYLTEHGYDGLVCPDCCACELSDLDPGGCLTARCRPGYKRTDTPDDDDGECAESLEIDGWWMSTEKGPE